MRTLSSVTHKKCASGRGECDAGAEALSRPLGAAALTVTQNSHPHPDSPVSFPERPGC